MKLSVASVAAVISAATVAAVPGWGPHHWPGHSSPHSWNLKQFTSLVIFGDSYSDDSRLGYFIENNGSAPPVGWVDPVVSHPTQIFYLKRQTFLIIQTELRCF